jgi:hypothetical protein
MFYYMNYDRLFAYLAEYQYEWLRFLTKIPPERSVKFFLILSKALRKKSGYYRYFYNRRMMHHTLCIIKRRRKG